MLKDRMVRIKMRKFYREQRPLSYVGKVTGFNDFWVVLAGKMVMVCRNQPKGVGGEIQLTDALQTLAVGTGEGEGVYGVVFKGRRFDCGSKPGSASTATTSTRRPARSRPR